jgi:hypothetical protein
MSLGKAGAMESDVHCCVDCQTLLELVASKSAVLDSSENGIEA